MEYNNQTSLPSQQSLVIGPREERVEKMLMNDNKANDTTTETKPVNK